MKKLEDKVAAFAEEHGLDHSHETAILDLVSEVGEVAKEILSSTDYGSTSFKTTKELELEVGDVYYSLITLAGTLDIDLEKALDLALEKYKERIKQKGHPGEE